MSRGGRDALQRGRLARLSPRPRRRRARSLVYRPGTFPRTYAAVFTCSGVATAASGAAPRAATATPNGTQGLHTRPWAPSYRMRYCKHRSNRSRHRPCRQRLSPADPLSGATSWRSFRVRQVNGDMCVTRPVAAWNVGAAALHDGTSARLLTGETAGSTAWPAQARSPWSRCRMRHTDGLAGPPVCFSVGLQLQGLVQPHSGGSSRMRCAISPRRNLSPGLRCVSADGTPHWQGSFCGTCSPVRRPLPLTGQSA